MAIHLRDIIAAQLQAEKEKPVERMSVAEFRKLVAESRETSEAQQDTLAEISTDVNKTNMAQLSQQVDEAKADNIAKEVGEATTEALDDINETLKKQSNDQAKESKESKKNFDKLADEIKKSVEARPNVSNEEAARITDKSKGFDQFKTIGERIQEKKEAVKYNFGTLRGLANTVGLVKKGSGGIMDTMLAKREARIQYGEDAVATASKENGPVDERGIKATAERNFNSGQKLAPEMRKNEKEIARLKEEGYNEEQIANTGLIEKRAKLATEYSSYDSRVQEKQETAERVSTDEAPSKKMEAVKEPIDAGAFSDEAQIEGQRLQESTVDLLTKIEENTRAGKDASVKPGKEDSKGKGFLDNIMGFLSKGFMSAIKVIFSPKNLLKAFTKVFVPAMIIGSLISGIMDGFKKFTETGSISEALIAGLGGILDFLTFGLFDAEKLKSVIDFVGKAIDGFIDPIKNFFTSMIDGITGFISDFTIPKITLGTVMGKEFSVGPFQPFKKNAKTEVPTAPTSDMQKPVGKSNTEFAGAGATGSWDKPKPYEATEVYKKSADNVAASTKQDTQPIVISAPTTNNTSNQKQNITMPRSVRNDDSGFNRYVSKNAVFA